MRRGVLLFALCSTLGVAAHFVTGCDSSYGADDPKTPAESDGGSDTGSGDSGPLAPPGCDATKDPRDEACLLTEDFAVFVSATGDDAAAGTKAAPVRTINKAIGLARGAKKPRVIVCEGSYVDPIVIDGANASALGIHGGFECRTWAPTDAKSRVAPLATGSIALRVSGTTSPVVIHDLDLIGSDGDGLVRTSVGVHLINANSVTLKRVRISAGKGFLGPNGQTITNVLDGAALKGNNATGGAGAAGGAAKTCACPVGGSSIGGKGGTAGLTPQQGQSGTTDPARVPAWPDNHGTGLLTGCAGLAGMSGADGTGGGGATLIATVDPLGVTEGVGSPGTAGSPAQGGGGGYGYQASQGSGPPVIRHGGGGGCGSCGGGYGMGGAGGGSSIGILSFHSTLDLVGSEITTAQGANGGSGGIGEVASIGGAPGSPSDGSCFGGPGGVGGTGGGGGGGAGGSSIGILYVNIPPRIDGGATQSVGSLPNVRLGANGTGGPGGVSSTPTATGKEGIPGITVAVHELQSSK